MQFAEYVKLFEAGPATPMAGIGAPTAPLGGPVGFGGGPTGQAPMPLGGPMGASPLGGAPPLDMGMGGADPSNQVPTPPTNIKTKDVWQVLDKILSKKSKTEEPKHKQSML